MSYIRSSVADVSVHLSHHADVFIAVQERVLFVFHGSVSAPVRGLVSFQAGMRQDDDEALAILVGGSYWYMLLGYELWQLRRRT